jgi:hypothetical protein
MEREELHRRIELLRKNLNEGKLHIPEHLMDGFRESLSKVKFAADGMVNPDTVDGRIRSMCLAVAHLNDRQEWKEAVTLKQIQESYFQRVELAFGDLFEKMQKANANPYSFSGWYCSEVENVTNALPIIDEFLEEIQSFWGNISEPTWIHLEDSIDSKAVFTGELFPDGKSNIASSTGLYFDTTILPDPFLRIRPLLKVMSDKDICYDIIRLALQVLSYKELALAELDKPIIAILPDRNYLDNDYQKFIFDCAISDTIEHTKTILNEEFSNEEEVAEYYGQFTDAQEIVKKLIKPEKLIFATEWDGDLATQINRFLKEEASKLGAMKPGQAVYMHLFSRFSQANDAFQRSLELKGTPIIRAETSWIWYNQMLEYNAGNSTTKSLNDLHIGRALNTTVKKEMSWMGNIPPASLIEMRQTGALDEIRHILSGSIKDLTSLNPKNFYRTGDQVFDNLDGAFREHERKIKDLSSKKWIFAGKDISSFVVVGGIEITAALTGLPMYGTLGSMASMTGVIPTVKDLKEKYRALTAEESKISNTGIGILLRSKKTN